MKDARPKGNNGFVAEEADSVQQICDVASRFAFLPRQGNSRSDGQRSSPRTPRHAPRSDGPDAPHRNASAGGTSQASARPLRYGPWFPLIKSRRETRRPRTAFPSSSTPGDKPTAPERDSQLLCSDPASLDPPILREQVTNPRPLLLPRGSSFLGHEFRRCIG